MNDLDQIEWMLDDLLTDRGRDSCKHEKCWLDSVMGFDDVDGPSPVQFGRQDGGKEIALQFTVVFGHEAVVSLGFDILESCKKGGVAEGVFDKRKTPARKHSSRADLVELAPAILPH